MTVSEPVLQTDLSGVQLFKRGKVRDVYDLSDHLLIVATDRISAFDVILPTGIPLKGAVLTALSTFWFEKTRMLVDSHFVSSDIEAIVSQYPVLKPHREILAGRSMLVRKAEVVPMECVVRGYLSGSGWKEYQKSRSVCGVALPAGLKESEQLPEPIFTPATKEESGHDINISEAEMAKRVGKELTEKLRKASLSVYAFARNWATACGIIIADTKFEFGQREGKVILVDEVLTPDSSRFWPLQGYAPGGPQASFDKQFVRDYLEEIRWDKKPPAPALPEEIARKTGEKYLDALRKLTGKELDR